MACWFLRYQYVTSLICSVSQNSTPKGSCRPGVPAGGVSAATAGTHFPSFSATTVTSSVEPTSCALLASASATSSALPFLPTCSRYQRPYTNQD